MLRFAGETDATLSDADWRDVDRESLKKKRIWTCLLADSGF
ncbi:MULTISPECIES: hypothetical protein [Leptolyngbya]|nr:MULTISPECIES: hypothetical protein [Leptolyngbya]